MRTTVNINEHILAEIKVIAARTHRTIGSVMEDALQKLIDDHRSDHSSEQPFQLPRFNYSDPGTRRGIDLLDKEQLAELLGDNTPPLS